MDKKEYYWQTEWAVADVQQEQPSLTDEEAQGFLEQYEKHATNRIIELGWEVMNHFLYEYMDARKQETSNE